MNNGKSKEAFKPFSSQIRRTPLPQRNHLLKKNLKEKRSLFLSFDPKMHFQYPTFSFLDAKIQEKCFRMGSSYGTRLLETYLRKRSE